MLQDLIPALQDLKSLTVNTQTYPTFSIIMPTKNRCHIIWKAILSIIKQTYPFWELLILDDKSKDKTGLTINQFNDPRIKYFKNKQTKGAPACRNLGLKKAKGKYIAYLDDDNTWHKEFLQIMLNAYQKNPNKIAIFCKKNFRLKIINQKNQTETIRNELTHHKKHFDLKRLWARKILIDTNTLTHKRQEIIKLGGWDENLKFWEDFELSLNISAHYPEGLLSLNRTLVDYEQVLNFKNPKETQKIWQKAEKYIYNKYKNNPLIKYQKWYPPQKYKSTISVIKFLRRKKIG